MERQTLTTSEVAHYIGVSKDLILKLVHQNEIPYFRLGRRILYRMSSIDKWIMEQEKNAEKMRPGEGASFERR